MAEYADLVVADKDDTAVAVFELGKLRNEFLGHRHRTSALHFGHHTLTFHPAGLLCIRPLFVLAFWCH
jgi:hypothetical protein